MNPNLRQLLFVVLAIFAAVLAQGCIVREVRPARPCANAVWVEGHYGPRGAWHPAHWKCAAAAHEVIIR